MCASTTTACGKTPMCRRSACRCACSLPAARLKKHARSAAAWRRTTALLRACWKPAARRCGCCLWTRIRYQLPTTAAAVTTLPARCWHLKTWWARWSAPQRALTWRACTRAASSYVPTATPQAKATGLQRKHFFWIIRCTTARWPPKAATRAATGAMPTGPATWRAPNRCWRCWAAHSTTSSRGVTAPTLRPARLLIWLA